MPSTRQHRAAQVCAVQRRADKSSWGGRRPYGRMIDPSVPRHAKRLLTVPEDAKVLQDAVPDVLDRGVSLRARPLAYGVIRACPFGIGQGSRDSTRTDG